MSVFLILVIGVGFIFGRVYNSSIILWIAVGFSSIMTITSYWFSDKIVLRMAGAKEVAKKADHPELYRMIENLAIAAGLPTPKIYIIDEAAPNAFATGRDPKHSVVAVTRGLLQRLDKSELEGVLAHELSHIKNRDMLVSTVAVILVGFVAIVSDIFLRSLFFRNMFGGRRDSEGGGANAIVFIIGIAAALLAPIAASLMQLAISRKREFLADASGALMTRYPDGLASALAKIAHDPTPMKHARTATAHLYIESPFKTENPTTKIPWYVKLFMTHPPTHERIAALRGMRI